MDITVVIFATTVGSVVLVFLLANVVLVCIVAKKIWNVHTRLTHLETWKNDMVDKEGSMIQMDNILPGDEDDVPLTDTPSAAVPIENISRGLDAITEDASTVEQPQSGASRIYANLMLTKGSYMSRSNASINSAPNLLDQRNCGRASSTRNLIQDSDSRGNYINIAFDKRKASSFSNLDTASNVSYNVVPL